MDHSEFSPLTWGHLEKPVGHTGSSNWSLSLETRAVIATLCPMEASLGLRHLGNDSNPIPSF